MDFSIRSSELELLDQPKIPKNDLYQNLRELHTINSLLGGYKVVFEGIHKLIASSHQKSLRILDIGSGGGDTLKEIHKHFKNDINLELIGVDLKEDCIQYAQENCTNLPITFIQSDYKDYLNESPSFDIIICSLFCHHLPQNDLIDLFKNMKKFAKVGSIINDLHRHFLAYYSIKWLTRTFSKSYLVKNDACLSVARSFSRQDISDIMLHANIQHYNMNWKWAFRWLIIF